MNIYSPTQGDWVRYCKEVLNRDEPLLDSFYASSKDRREWRNFRAWYIRQLSEADRLTARLIHAGANREKVIAIVDGYGDPVDWNYHSLDSIIAEVWQSDLNSGDEPDSWIINEICRQFNIKEVTE